MMPLIYYIPRRNPVTNQIEWVADTNFSQTSLLLSPSIPAATSFAADASTINNEITVRGAVRPTNFTPFNQIGYYSTQFSGTSSYLYTTSASSAFNYGTGNFTIEFWVFPKAGPVSAYNPTFFTNHGSGSWNDTSKGLRIHHRNALLGGTTLTFTNAMVNNRWSHFALVRVGNTVTAYINGIANGSATITAALGDDTDKIALSTSDTVATTGREFLNGYMSNVRIVKGTAVYTANFTPPTAPLTAIAGTSLLICQNSNFIDNSPNNFTLTVGGTGVTKIQSFIPFSTDPTLYTSSGSTYFGGNGDYLSASTNSAQFSNGDFTIEFWINLSSSAALVIIEFRSSVSVRFGQIYVDTARKVHFYLPTDVATTNTLTLNAWNHVAISRRLGTLSMFINGVSGYSANNLGIFNAEAVVIGNYSGAVMTGYLSNLRFVTGTAIYTANFNVPTSPLTAIAGTSLLTCQTNQPTNNSQFLDSSNNNSVVSNVGNAIQGSVSPFTANATIGYSPTISGGSAYFNGSTVLSSTLPTGGLSSGNFTIETWIYQTAIAASNVILDTRTVDLASTGIALYIDSSYRVGIFTSSGIFTSTGFITTNAWTHIALVRNLGTITCYINGTASGIVSASTNYSDTTLAIGSNKPRNTWFTGYISNLRIVVGTAVYTSNFLPSFAPLTSTPDTTLLLKMDSASIVDATRKQTITTIGDVKITNKVVKYGTNSMYFDGVGDGLMVPSSTAMAPGTGDFTYECWVYPTSSTITYRMIFGLDSYGGSTPFRLYQNSTVFALWYTSNSNIVSSTIAINAWHHVAMTRAGTSLRLFVNGTQVGSTVSTLTNYAASNFRVGSDSSSTYPFIGYISDLRVTLAARYTANFTPPAAAFPIV